MARQAKALVQPESGYRHREHRSKKTSKPFYQFKKRMKKRIARLQEKQPNGRKGKWKT